LRLGKAKEIHRNQGGGTSRPKKAVRRGTKAHKLRSPEEMQKAHVRGGGTAVAAVPRVLERVITKATKILLGSNKGVYYGRKELEGARCPK